jgi:hypothetical protein
MSSSRGNGGNPLEAGGGMATISSGSTRWGHWFKSSSAHFRRSELGRTWVEYAKADFCNGGPDGVQVSRVRGGGWFLRPTRRNPQRPAPGARSLTAPLALLIMMHSIPPGTSLALWLATLCVLSPLPIPLQLLSQMASNRCPL